MQINKKKVQKSLSKKIHFLNHFSYFRIDYKYGRY